MLMMICGAGASYDSLPDFKALGGATPPRPDYRPPRGQEIFQRRGPFEPWVARYRQCSPLFPRLRRPDINIEQELEKIRSEALYDPQRAVQLNAIRYYLKRVIWECSENWPKLTSGVTNYAYLLDRIRNWQARHPVRLALVTFNYDCLLEDGCGRALGISFPSCAAYVEHDQYKVFKLHGSVSWVRFVETSVGLAGKAPDLALIDLGPHLRLSSEYRQAGVGDDMVDGRPVFPAIAIPVETKSDFECPLEHLEVLKGILPSVKKVVIIGWRATEAHFLALWSERISAGLEVQIVAGSKENARSTQSNLEQAGIRARFDLSEYPFSQYLETDELERFLGVR